MCGYGKVLGDGRTADFFLVSFEDAELFHGADVKDAHGLVARGTGDEVAVRGPRKGLDRVFMLVTTGMEYSPLTWSQKNDLQR